METSSFGDAARPCIPLAFALCSDDRVIFTCGSEFLALSPTDWQVQYQLKTSNGSGICAATLAGEDFILATQNRLLERRRCQDGSLVAKYVTQKRFSSMSYYENQVLAGDKDGEVELLAWELLAEESDRLLKVHRDYLRSTPSDISYRKTHGWIEETFADSPIIQETGAAVKESQKPVEILGELYVSPQTLNKFDSGKDLATMRAEFESAMGRIVLGHIATITTIKAVKLDKRFVCLTCDRDEKICIAKLPELFELEAVLCGHFEFPTDVLVVDNNTLLSAGADCTIRLWSVDKQQQLGPSLELPGVPLQLRQCADAPFSVEVLCAQSTEILRVVVVDDIEVIGQRSLRAAGTRNLAHVPLVLGPHETYLDIEGRVFRATDGAIASFEDAPSFLQLYKHDRGGSRGSKKPRTDQAACESGTSKSP